MVNQWLIFKKLQIFKLALIDHLIYQTNNILRYSLYKHPIEIKVNHSFMGGILSADEMGILEPF